MSRWDIHFAYITRILCSILLVLVCHFSMLFGTNEELIFARLDTQILLEYSNSALLYIPHGDVQCVLRIKGLNDEKPNSTVQANAWLCHMQWLQPLRRSMSIPNQNKKVTSVPLTNLAKDDTI
jgi:hypothetical protein